MSEHIFTEEEFPEPAEVGGIKKYADIPLANRLAHLNIHPASTGATYSGEEIARHINSYGHWVNRTAARLGIEPDEYVGPFGHRVFDYPDFALDLLGEEWRWQQHVSGLPTQLTSGRIAEEVGRSQGWTVKTLAELEINVTRGHYGDRLIHLYPRFAVSRLRDLTLATPPDEGWYTLGRLAELTGFNREWIARRLEEVNVRAETRRSMVTGRELAYFPPDALDVLAEAAANRSPGGGDWVTTERISTELNRSYHWVTKRLDEQYLDFGDIRQDDMGVDRVHYPAAIFSALKAESERLKSIPQAEDWRTKSGIARKLGRSTLWVTNRIEIIEAEVEERLDRLGRPKPHYSPRTQVELERLNEF